MKVLPLISLPEKASEKLLHHLGLPHFVGWQNRTLVIWKEEALQSRLIQPFTLFTALL